MAPLIAACEKDPASGIMQRIFPSGARLLEAGAGSGRWMIHLSKMGYDITGLELSAEMCERFSSQFAPLRMLQGDIRNMPFEDGSFDGVISLGAVEHVPEGPEQSLREIARVLRPGGRAFITVPNYALFQALFFRAYYPVLVRRYPDLREQLESIDRNTRKDMFCLKQCDASRKNVGFFEYKMPLRKLVELACDNGLQVDKAFTMYPDIGMLGTLRWLKAARQCGPNVELTAVGKLVKSLVPHGLYNHMACVVCSRP